MISINKLKVIAEAKFKNKNNLGDWYKTRLDICEKCPLNSKNKGDLSIKELAMVALNIGKDTCLACGCDIKAKTSVRSSVCGLVEIGEEPIWEALPEITSEKISNVKIDNLSADKVTMKIENGEVIFDYGNIKYKEDSNIQFSVMGLMEEIKQLTVGVTCGCTTATPKKIGNTYFVNLKYNTDIVGKFSKSINFLAIKIGGNYTFKGKITGTVNNK